MRTFLYCPVSQPIEEVYEEMLNQWKCQHCYELKVLDKVVGI